MRTRHLLGIVLVIWIPLGYHLLADDELIAEIPLLEQQFAKGKPTVDNYDINLMAISEIEADPISTLEQVVNYQSPADAPYQSLRLPELETLTEFNNPLLCDLSKLDCRQKIASQQTAVAQLLANHSSLLQQYEALQHLSNTESAEAYKVGVNGVAAFQLDKLYALHIYYLMLEGDNQLAEFKLIALIKQQRRFLNSDHAAIRRTLAIGNFSEHYLPLAIELSQQSDGSRAALAEVLQPFTLDEVTGIASRRYEFVQMLEWVRLPQQAAAQADIPSLSYKLLFKPNLTANTLYKLNRLADITQLNTKRDWYMFYNYPANSSMYLDANSFVFWLTNYRNFIGASYASAFLPAVDGSNQQLFETDLQLYLLQPMLLNDLDNAEIDFASFALNPYDNSSVVYNNGLWCYVLEKDICLTAPQDITALVEL